VHWHLSWTSPILLSTMALALGIGLELRALHDERRSLGPDEGEKP
jgi:hypothetical protein